MICPGEEKVQKHPSPRRDDGRYHGSSRSRRGIRTEPRVVLQQSRKGLYITFKLRKKKPVIVELVHFRDSLRDRSMLDGNAVSRDHDSGAICAALAMNKYPGRRVRANQVEKFHNLGR